MKNRQTISLSDLSLLTGNWVITKIFRRRAAGTGLLAASLVTGIFLTTAPAHAVLLGNLAADYQNGTTGQTSTDIGISGSGGTWSYWSDTDADPTNGGLTLLTFGNVGLEGGDGFAGTGTILDDCCGPFPLLSDDGLFDGITTPPAGTLASHPGGSLSSNIAPEFLAIEFRVTSAFTGFTIDYSIDHTGTVSGGNDGIDWRILDSAGSSIASGLQNGNSVSVTGISIADLATNESIWLVLGNGPADKVASDQTFLSLSVNAQTAVVPVPAAVWLFGGGLISLISVARRKEA